MRNHPGVTATVLRARWPTAGVNIETDLHLRDPDLGDLPRRPARRRRPGRARRVRAGRRRATPSCTRGRGGERDRSTRPTGRRWPSVGATGAVGTMMIDIIEPRESVPWGEIRLVASPRSAGQGRCGCAARTSPCRRWRPEVFDGVDVAHVRRAGRGQRAVGADRRRARRGGGRQLRRVPDGPGRAAGRPRGQRRAGRAYRPKGIIANPNCTTLSMMAALGALHREFGLRALVVASYQAASGAGQPGIDRLQAEIAAVAGDGRRRARRRRRRRRSPRRPGGLAVPGAAGAERRAVGRVAQGRRVVVRGAEGPQRVAQDPRHRRTSRCRRPASACRSSPRTRSRCTRRSPREVVGARPRARCSPQQPTVVLRDDPAAGEFPTPADVVGDDPT